MPAGGERRRIKPGEPGDAGTVANGAGSSPARIGAPETPILVSARFDPRALIG
jgi:hypothetical protein